LILTGSLGAVDALAAMFYVYKNTTQKAPWIRGTTSCILELDCAPRIDYKL